MDPSSPELNNAVKGSSNSLRKLVPAGVSKILFGLTAAQYLKEESDRYVSPSGMIEYIDAEYPPAITDGNLVYPNVPKTLDISDVAPSVVNNGYDQKKPSQGITIPTSSSFSERTDPFLEEFYDGDGRAPGAIGSLAAGEFVRVEEVREFKKPSSQSPPLIDEFKSRRGELTPTTNTTTATPTTTTRQPASTTTGRPTSTTTPESELDSQPVDLSSAVRAAVESPYFNDPLEAESNYQDSVSAFRHRLERYRFVSNGNVPKPKMDSPESGILFENIIENNKKLAPYGGLHRNLAIPLALRYRNPQERERLMQDFDDAARRNTRDVIDRVESGELLDYDIFIRGGGEYAAVAAQHIRELAPELKIFVADQNDHMGGQFADYGPRPALKMNSRVRVGGRYEPYVPRTDGDINSQGPYAILSLSDLQDDTYASNTVRGDMTKMAVTLAADDVAICTRAGEQTKRRDGRFDVPLQTRFEGEELEYNVRASVVIDARGIRQESALINVLGLDDAISDGRYYTTAELYRLFGGKYTAPGAMHDPMAAFDGKIVELDGFGDGAKTAAELLIRALPIETYGPRRREGPKGIRWVNAPGLTRDEIVAFLRSRYSGSFPQFLPKSYGDPGGILLPFIGKAVSQTYRNGTWRTLLTDGSNQSADIKIDTTNKAGKLDPDDMPGVLSLGPAFTRYIPSEPKELLDALRVSDNTDALWLRVPAALADTEEGIRIARAVRRR